MSNAKPSDRATVMATIDPDAYTAAAYTSDWVSMADFKSIQAIVMVGTMASTSTVDAKLQMATDSSGTGNTDITGKAITQLTEAGADSDKQAVINLRDDELTDGYTHVALVITVATAASDVAGIILGMDAAYQSPTDLASVDEVID